MTTLADIGEDQFIKQFIQPIAAPLNDDCAWQQSDLRLISCDAFIERVHFTQDMPADWVGQKIVRATISDIIASGGIPRAILFTASMPAHTPVDWLETMLVGVHEACVRFEVQLIGGDSSASKEDLMFSVTALGSSTLGRPITRAGARVGDRVLVSGVLGESAIGLQESLKGSRNEIAAKHFLRPLPIGLVSDTAFLEQVHAMMDLSDGLVRDVLRMSRASGVGFHIDLDKVPIPEDGDRETAWIGGEDYELLMCVPSDRVASLVASAKILGITLTHIGEVTKEQDVIYRINGHPYRFSKPVWDHF